MRIYVVKPLLSEIKLWTPTYKSNASYTFLGKSTQIVTENSTQIEKKFMFVNSIYTKQNLSIILMNYLTVGLGQKRYIPEIEKSKICSNVLFSMGNIMT